MRTLCAVAAVLLLALAAQANILKSVEHEAAKVSRKVRDATGLQSVVNATPLCGSPSTATVSFVFSSQSACEAYVSTRSMGGHIGESWSNCTTATVCLAFEHSVSGTVAGHPVLGIAMYNVGTGSIAFDSNATTTAALASYSNSYLGATQHPTSLTFSGDCSNTYGALTVQQYPVSTTAIQSFNFNSC